MAVSQRGKGTKRDPRTHISITPSQRGRWSSAGGDPNEHFCVTILKVGSTLLVLSLLSYLTFMFQKALYGITNVALPLATPVSPHLAHPLDPSECTKAYPPERVDLDPYDAFGLSRML